jgi:peptide/nickel transport system permease protein
MPRRDRLAVAALVAFFALLFVAVYGERIAPNEQIYFVVEHGKDPRPFDPGLVFPLGSDVLGRDLFSVVLAGARATISIVLLAALARVTAGVLVAVVGLWFRPARLVTETIADVVAAVPATLVAVIFIKAFVKSDTTVPIVIGTLLLVGWAGPYRVLRAEVDRLSHAPFTIGARVLGVSRWRLFWRHHIPHLVPVMAINLSQQVVASLVLLAELGVLGIVLSTARSLNVEESMSVVRAGPPQQAIMPDIPEWGAMLASSRTIEILWATRWVIFIPGAAFAITAGLIALIGFALARRYARRDIYKDFRLGLGVAIAAVLLVAAQGLVPERYAAARSWAADARSFVTSATDVASALDGAGLELHEVTASHTTIVRTGQAKVTVAGVTLDQSFRLPNDSAETVRVRSLVSADYGGGGIVEAPLIFAARGIVPLEDVPTMRYFTGRGKPELKTLVRNYPNDYAGLDVRGKVVVLARFIGIDAGVRGLVPGTSPGDAIFDALKRGAAGVIFVDPGVGDPKQTLYPNLPRYGLNPYDQIEVEFPPRSLADPPVIVVDPIAGARLLGPLGVDLSPYFAWDKVDAQWSRVSRDLPATARLEVPVRADVSTATSLVAETPGLALDDGRIVVWSPANLSDTSTELARRDVLLSLARFAAARHLPFAFVWYDPRLGPDEIRRFLYDRRVLLVAVLDDVERTTFRFTTANGDLIPAFDLYAENAGLKHDITRKSVPVDFVGAPLPELKTIVITTYGEKRDARADFLALLGYAAGRRTLGAPELGP